MKKKPNSNDNIGAVDSRPGFTLAKICILFVSAILAFNLIEWLVLKPGDLFHYQHLTAQTVSSLIDASGIQTKLQGTHVFFENVHWEIVTECTALQAMYVFCAFVIAYPSSIKAKLIGLLSGIPFLFSANILRLFVLAWAHHFFPQYAEVVHDYIWQVAFLFLLCLMWLFWIDMVVKREKVSSVSA